MLITRRMTDEPIRKQITALGDMRTPSSCRIPTPAQIHTT